MHLYLLNSLIIPFNTDEKEIVTFIAQKINLQKYIEILSLAKKEKLKVKSFIGYDSTVKFLKDILPKNLKSLIKYNRGHIYLKEGDLALVFRIIDRAEQLKEYSYDEVSKLYQKGKCEFVFVSRVYAPEFILNPSNYFYLGEK